MADYQLTATDAMVVHHTVRRPTGEPIDQHIPNDPANEDWIAYQEWLAEGGVPDPYVPPPEPEDHPAKVALYDHENRIRALEGQPAITQAEFNKRGGFR